MIDKTVVPKSLVRVVSGTVLIGLLAHMMGFTNFWSNADNTFITYSFGGEITDYANGGRWLLGIFDRFGRGVNIPWLSGIFSLICYGIAVWAVTEVFDVNDDIVRVVIGGLLVVSPSVAVEYTLVGNIGGWSFAHLFSGLAVYTFYKVKYGRLISCILMFLATGIYAPNVLLTVSFILVKEIIDNVFQKEEEIKHVVVRQVIVIVFFIFSMAGNYTIQQLLLRIHQVEAQRRVSLDAEDNVLFNGSGLHGWIAKYNECIHEIFYNTKLTLFKSKLLLVLFIVSLLLTVILTVIVLIKKRVWRQPGRIALLLLDIACLPIAMNGMVFLTHTHKNMQVAFIMPWVYIVLFTVYLVNEDISLKIINIATIISASLIVVTLVNWIIIDNIANTKRYAHYTAGIMYANRLEARLECLDGYIPGNTPVYFIGNPSSNCYWRTDEFSMLYEWPYIGDCGFSSAYSTAGTLALEVFINQHLGTMINRVQYFEQCELYKEQIESLGEFPQANSIMWADDTVIVNLGQNNN